MIDTKLETLLKVVETKNFSLAAKQLNLTQPAISQHIKQLENEHNIKIFNRSGNSIILTNQGEILVKYAKRIASLYKELDTKLSDEKKHKKSITIGMSHTSESNIVAEVLAYYSSKNRGTHIKIISDNIKKIYDKLSSYAIDLAIVEGKAEKKYSSVLLATDSLMAVISKENPLSKQKMVNITNLKKEKMILRSANSSSRSLFDSQIENIGMSIDDFNVILEMDNIATIKDLVEKNVGVSVLPKSCCYSELKSGKLAVLPIENLNLAREINMVFLKDAIEINLLNDLFDTYKELTNK